MAGLPKPLRRPRPPPVPWLAMAAFLGRVLGRATPSDADHLAEAGDADADEAFPLGSLGSVGSMGSGAVVAAGSVGSAAAESASATMVVQEEQVAVAKDHDPQRMAVLPGRG